MARELLSSILPWQPVAPGHLESPMYIPPAGVDRMSRNFATLARRAPPTGSIGPATSLRVTTHGRWRRVIRRRAIGDDHSNER